MIVTDDLASYRLASKSEFYDHHQSFEHIADVVLRESHKNVLEMMHGPIRKREKVDNTPIIPMNLIHYNFIRPHKGLERKMLVEMEGIGIDGENKWISLSKRSMRRN